MNLVMRYTSDGYSEKRNSSYEITPVNEMLGVRWVNIPRKTFGAGKCIYTLAWKCFKQL